MINIKVLASGSSGNCYVIDDGSTKIMIEVGIPWKQVQRKLDFKTHEIDAILVSHEHKDHAGYVKDAAKASIELYMTEGTRAAIGSTSAWINAITPGVQFTLGTWTILPFEVQHDATEPVGYLLANKVGDKLLFITDSCYCRYLFQGLTHVMIETNYDDDILRANVEAGVVPVELKNRIIQSHFSLANVKEFFRANKDQLSMLQEIHLIHLSDNNSNADLFKREIQALTGKPTYIA